jgi:hypothetical protein
MAESMKRPLSARRLRSGWLVVERSRNAKGPKNVQGNFGANTRYL